MKPKFIINKVNLRTLRVSGIHPSVDSTIYKEEFTDELDEFTYEETVSLNGLYTIDSKENEELIDVLFTLHSLDLFEDCDFEIKKDSLYAVKHVVLPNEKWLAHYLAVGNTWKMPYCLIYYYDTETLKVMYKHVTEEDPSLTDGWAEVCPETLFEVNLESDVFSVYREDQYTFLMPDLRTCLYNISQSLLNELCPKNCNSSSLSEAVYNRDLLWMGINVIKYQLDLGNFFKAQGILETLEDCCSGICKPNSETKQVGGCGCGK